MAAKEDDVAAELEALQAVYGDDCSIVSSHPPHLHLRLIPRTADLTSQQFVEAVIEIRAGLQYPEEPPSIDLIDSKGLDEQRKELLVNCVRDRAIELNSCLMLVALCEEAVERLTLMNHPDGDCPLCLDPLVQEDEQTETLPFMKLMSCFHCFHCECIIRWWNWLQTDEKSNSSSSSSSAVHTVAHVGDKKGQDEPIGTCPVCRKVFHTKDFEHVLDLVGSFSVQSISEEMEAKDSEEVLHSESESIRRQRYEATLKLQEENSGLAEPIRSISFVPGMVGSISIVPAIHPPQPTAATTEEPQDPQSEGPSERRCTSKQANSGRPRRPRHRNYTRKPARQWVEKHNGSA